MSLSKAIEYYKVKDYSSAAQSYRAVYIINKDEIDLSNRIKFATSLRKCGNSKEALEICRETYKINSKSDALKNVYAWCIYDLEIKKQFDDIEPEMLFKAAKAIVSMVKQETFSPYEKTVWKVINYLKDKPNFNGEEVLYWLDKLNENYLSTESFTIKDAEQKDRELASPKEKWYFLKSKALEHLKKYNQCLELIKEINRQDIKFHGESETWIKVRKAKCYYFLGNLEEAKKEFEGILKLKKHWSISYDLAKINYELKDMDKALLYCYDAVLDRTDYTLKVNVFEYMAKLIILNNNIDNNLNIGREHLLLSYLIRKEKNWKVNEQLGDKFNEDETIKNLNSQLILNGLRKFWQEEKKKTLPKFEGEVKKILPNGASGFIMGENGEKHFFRYNSFYGKKELIYIGLKVEFYVSESYDVKKGVDSTEAVYIKPVY